jgi:hypothetical protein
MTIQIPIQNYSNYWSVMDGANNIIHSGKMTSGQLLMSGQTSEIHDQDVNVYLDLVNQSPAVAPPLPVAGTELNEGEIYAWSGENVEVRQSHIRTADDPATVPALFNVYRVDYDGMVWIANESVDLEDRRNYIDVIYSCIQAHVTQDGWEPPNVPALWQIVPVDSSPQPWVQPTGGHDAYGLGDEVTHNGNLWTSFNAPNVW